MAQKSKQLKNKSLNPVPKKTKTEKVDPKSKEVKNWLEKIKAGRKVKEDWQKLFRIDLGYAYRDGQQKPDNANASEWVTINKIYSILKSELPPLYRTDPFFFIKLATTYSPNPEDIPLFEQRGQMRQAMINYLKRELKMKKKMRVNILDAFFQFGVNKTHFSADVNPNPEKGKPINDDNDNPQFSDDGNPLVEPDDLVTNPKYNITRIHPNDISFDADAGVLEDTWSFVAEKITMTLDEAKESDSYDKTARESLKATEVSEEDMERARQIRKKGSRFKKSDVDPTLVVIYECYNLKKDEWFVVSEGSDQYLINPERVPDGTERHPYSFLFLGLGRDDSPYTVTPVSQWLDAQNETNEIRSKMVTHRKRFNRKYEMVDAAFDDPDNSATDLENGGDGTVLRRNAQWPNQAIFPIADASLDQNHLQEAIMVNRDFDELATGSNQQGSGAGIDSATEAGIVEKNVAVREGDDLGQVMEFVTDIGKKLDQLVQAHITRAQAVKVIGPEGEKWEIVKEDDYIDINGEFEYSVNAGATLPASPEIERAQWMQFLGLVGQNIHLATNMQLLKRTADMFRIDDDVLINELHAMAMKLTGNQTQIPGSGGSQPGIPDANAAGGAAGGPEGVNNIRGGKQGPKAQQ